MRIYLSLATCFCIVLSLCLSCVREVPCTETSASVVCPSGACLNGLCQPPISCSRDSDCSGNALCKRIGCVQAAWCETAGDCAGRACERVEIDGASVFRCKAEGCATGTTACAGACVNTQTDVNHCGGCDRKCTANQACNAGVCACPNGRTECGGACVDTQNDRQHCGGCGKICSSEQVCNAGVCACPSGRTECGGACVDTQNDKANCGACGNACTQEQFCKEGACVCRDGKTLCGGLCVDLQIDLAHCGKCGSSCKSGDFCDAGVCSNRCGLTQCGDVCVNLQSDKSHCGGCGKGCSSDQGCNQGNCTLLCGSSFCSAGQICHSGACVSAGMRQTFTASGVTFAIRYIPAGSFLMGSPDSDTGASLNQKPQRMVTITRGFWILETEVTQAQYNALVGSNPSGFKNCGGSCPVETMTWDEARNFANKLSAAQNLPPCTAVDASIFQCQGWRLPTEAEWEHAARAGTSAPRYGNTDDIAWHKGLNTKTQPVGGKQANAWGLYDMLGNVWEWTIDLYMDSHAVLGTLDPLGTFRADGATGRTRRGGGWLVEAKDIRAALRDVNGPTGSLGDTGFRLVRY